MLQWRPPRTPTGLWLLVFGLLILSGCRQEPAGPLCFPTSGLVRYDQKPLAEAMIVLHPLNPHPEDADAPKPIAISTADGSFQLTTLKPQDGAPAGDYIITVELREQRLDGDQLVRDGKNLLRERYRDPAKSPLKYQVIEGDNIIPVLELSSR